jgi:hypothetical protein
MATIRPCAAFPIADSRSEHELRTLDERIRPYLGISVWANFNFVAVHSISQQQMANLVIVKDHTSLSDRKIDGIPNNKTPLLMR